MVVQPVPAFGVDVGGGVKKHDARPAVVARRSGFFQALKLTDSLDSGITDADDLQSIHLDQFVVEDIDRGLAQDPQGTVKADIMLMIAGDKENAPAGMKPAQPVGKAGNISGHAVKQIAGDENSFRIESIYLADQVV